MNKKTRLIAAFILVLTGLFGEQLVQWAKDNVDFTPNTPDVVVVDEPSDLYQKMVKNVVDIDISKEHSSVLRPFFVEMASVIETDPGFLKSTGQFREFNIMAGAMNFAGQDIKGIYPDLGEAIDKAVISAIGKENIPLDGDRRERLVKILTAISWGTSQ
jgi:hypothetical protein